MMVHSLCLAGLLLVSVAATSADGVIGMNQRVLTKINEAQDQMDAGDLDAARGLLQALRENHRLSGYESAHVLNLLGYISYERDDFIGARELYEEALTQRRVPESLQASLRQTMGQIALAQEDYVLARQQFEILIDMRDQDTGNNRVLLASACFGQADYDSALKHLTRAIGEARSDGGTPPENWLSMLASVHYEREDFVAMRRVMEYLVSLYPREHHLMNLAALHGQLGDTERQLALVEALMDDGRIEQSHHLRMLASLFMALDLPYKAAHLLERELADGRLESTTDNLEQLSQAWFLAEETDRAIPPLEQAAQRSDDGKLFLRVARLYMDGYQWDAAARAASEARRRGGLDRVGETWLIEGMAMVRMKKLTRARSLFERAGGFDETSAYAEQWLAFVDSEQQRARALGGSAGGGG
jgi:tetratricopeptide (TPR) repeat protein